MDMKDIFSLFLHLFWPEHCPVCGRIGAAYCPECLKSVADPLQPFCLNCGVPWKDGCCAEPVPCYALAYHEGYAREFLLNLKYHNSRSLGVPMGRLMGEMLPRIKTDAIVPVPLHKNSTRAYNQTLLLARGIAEVQNIPCKDILKWRSDFGRQVEKRGHERMSLPLDSMGSENIDGTSVVLVDDVYTTGGTLTAAKAAVTEAGGRVAGALVWTRSVKRGDADEWSDVKDALSLELR
jgi:predicted amidophosphoribosyltransferase